MWSVPAPSPAGEPTAPHPRLLVLGAKGPTGRQLVHQALRRGHQVTALTRHPESFPIRHDRLHVVAGDATDPTLIEVTVAATDAVICTIGASFIRALVEVYSTSARLLVEAMTRQKIRRLVVVTSAGLAPTQGHVGVVGGALRQLMRNHIGKTVYDDMAAMEAQVSASDLDWTIVRPPGLTSQPGTGYAVAETRIGGQLCSREDLVGMLLDQLENDRFLEGVAAVATPGLKASSAHMLWPEVLKR